LILKFWRNGDVQFVLSSEIIDEYIKVSEILTEEHPKIDISSILTLIASHSETIQSIPLPHQVCEDPDDDKFLACAMSGRCDFIISGDKHLLRLSGYQGITVITPRAFVDQYIKK